MRNRGLAFLLFPAAALPFSSYLSYRPHGQLLASSDTWFASLHKMGLLDFEDEEGELAFADFDSSFAPSAKVGTATATEKEKSSNYSGESVGSSSTSKSPEPSSERCV